MGTHRPKERKDMIYMAKPFNIKMDGEFDYPENHSWKAIYGRRYDRTYLKYRLRDEIKERSNNGDASLWKEDCNIEDVYLVVCRCKKGTRLEKALIDMGFSLIKTVE